MGLPKEIADLIERFDRNLETYKGGQYNEAQLRQDFLNPFFGALGWDMANKAGYAEAYRDVIHEDAIKIGGATKAPDYCFRIGSVKKFFVEAKKPSVKLKDDVSPAFQLRRYAWSAKLPLSVLTDFEEFAVYDCRIKPVQTDKASIGRVLYFTYKDYPAKWDELVNIFSREAVLKGSFDKYAESSKLKKGTATVDDAFLTEIEDWRDMLARNIAIRNPDLSQRELNFAVQRTIDRIVFLRICEDRGIEEYGRLQMQLNGTNVYKRLVQLFSQADDRYNSGLFHFQREKDRHEEPDKLTPNISIDDKPLKDIINRLYYPESPYEFSVLSADILGQVYEQFLGKVIRLTAGHQAKVEEKPEVRKAGGVYYTPKYIVDYIVKNTVGRLLGAGDRGSEGTNANSDLQGSGSLAGGDEFNNRSIPPDEDISEGRNLRVDQPDATGSGINTGQHSGGPQPEIEKGISSSRVDSPGLVGGTGDASVIGKSVGLSVSAGLGQGVGNGAAGGTVDKRSASLPPSPDNRQLTPKQVSRLKILDPACGSGSFLLGAYQHLLDWHLKWYIENDPEKWAKIKQPTVYQGPSPDSRTPNWHLTTAEKKRILLNNIYGVDIDSQAVEVTKLSLLLKVLEGENNQTLANQLRMFHERALPDLGDNIKCGNSLIGPDFYKQQTMLNDDERYRVNVFDWEKEFPNIFPPRPQGEGRGEGGFDAVIGNPPYGALFSEKEKTYIQGKFKSYKYKFDSYIYFIETALDLTRKGGLVSYITPELWLKLENCSALRKLISENAGFMTLRVYGENVFSSAVVNTIVFVFQRGVPIDNLEIEMDGERWQLPSSTWKKSNARTIDYRLKPGNSSLIAKINAVSHLLAVFGEAIQGITPYDKYRGQSQDLIKRRGYHFTTKHDKSCGKWLAGKDVSRYDLGWSGEWLSYGPWLAAPREPRFFEGLRLLFREVPGSGKRIQATIAEESYYHGHSITPFKPNPNNKVDLRYLLGLANSRLLSWYGGLMLSNFGKDVFPKLNPQDIKELPIYPINFSDPIDKARHDKIVSLVEQMLSLHKQLQSTKTAHEKTALQRQIDAIDQQIDRLVYELYGLTEEEIKIVEVKAE